MSESTFRSVSTELQEIFCNDGGCLTMQCELCGRQHFAVYDNEGTYDPGELEDLRAKAEKDPDKYMEQNCSSLGFGYIGGRMYVYGCDCDEARRFELLLRTHASQIAEFLFKIATAEKKSLDATHVKVKKAHTAVKELKKAKGKED